jgi:hypothetical protein
VFTEHLTELSQIRRIVPVGSPAGIELKDHVFFNPVSPGSEVPVFAPADLRLTRIARYRESATLDGYTLEFRVTRDVSLKLAHLTRVVAAIEAAGPSEPSDHSGGQTPSQEVALAAGALIGWSVLGSWDVGVYDQRHVNSFANQARYELPPAWSYLHARCPFDLYAAPAKRAPYLAILGSVTGEPGSCAGACGSASGDVPGTLAGAWFSGGTETSTIASRMAVAATCDGAEVRIVGVTPQQIVVVGVIDPATVSTEICYADDDRYAYFQLTSAATLAVATAPGPCPAEMPAPTATYQR